MTLSETRKAEIGAIMADIRTSTRELRLRGINATDPRDVLDAGQIIKRIEERIIGNMLANQPAQPTTEAVE